MSLMNKIFILVFVLPILSSCGGSSDNEADTALSLGPTATVLSENPVIYARAVGVDSRQVVVGSTESDQTDSNTDALILKLDSDGKELWHSKIGGIDDDLAIAVAVDNEDNVHVITISDKTDFFLGYGSLLKFSQDGDLIYSKDLGSLGFTNPDGDYKEYGITFDSNNNVYVFGYFVGSILSKIDQNGVTQWTQILPEGVVGFRFIHDLIVHNNFIYAVGRFAPEVEPYLDQGLIMKFDSDGLRIFEEAFDSLGSLVADVEFDKLIINDDGTLTATGTILLVQDNDVLVVNYDNEGNKLNEVINGGSLDQYYQDNTTVIEWLQVHP